MEEENRVKSCFWLPEPKHHAVRIWCAENKRKVQDVFAEAMEDWISRNIEGKKAKVAK